MLLTIEFPVSVALRRTEEGRYEASWKHHLAEGESGPEALGRLKLQLEEVGMLHLAKLYRPGTVLTLPAV